MVGGLDGWGRRNNPSLMTEDIGKGDLPNQPSSFNQNSIAIGITSGYGHIAGSIIFFSFPFSIFLQLTTWVGKSRNRT